MTTRHIRGTACGCPVVVEAREDEGRLYCIDCGMSYVAETSLIAHAMQHHPHLVKGLSGHA